MVRTRNHVKAAKAKRERDEAHVKFKFAYKDLTPAQQSISRHNRFLRRVWKVPRRDRIQHRQCVACLGDLLERGSGYFGIMACDHVIHLDCLIKHADAYADRVGVPRLDNPQSMTEAEFHEAAVDRFMYRRLGAPCPVCRMDYPMQHMAVFDQARPAHIVPKEPPASFRFRA